MVNRADRCTVMDAGASIGSDDVAGSDDEHELRTSQRRREVLPHIAGDAAVIVPRDASRSAESGRFRSAYKSGSRSVVGCGLEASHALSIRGARWGTWVEFAKPWRSGSRSFGARNRRGGAASMSRASSRPKCRHPCLGGAALPLPLRPGLGRQRRAEHRRGEHGRNFPTEPSRAAHTRGFVTHASAPPEWRGARGRTALICSRGLAAAPTPGWLSRGRVEEQPGVARVLAESEQRVDRSSHRVK